MNFRGLSEYLVLICACLQVFLLSCKENPSAPGQPIVGVSGIIYGSDSSIIAGAKVYCLYFLYGVPDDPPPPPNLQKLSSAAEFHFELFQNFPNPCSHSFYVRFSLPEECATQLSIRSNLTQATLYRRTVTLPYGLFQLYFPRIVDTLSLSNGLYTYHLSARGKTGKIYDAEKTLFVVSDSSVANAVSDSTGRYYFDGKDAFIGDSVTVMFGQNPGYGRLLDGSVMLLIIKDGYESQRISVDLLQGTILARDIVLRKIR